MNKFEIRKSALRNLIEKLGRGGIAIVSNKTGIDASYISRMLYPPEKSGAKNIGEGLADKLTAAFPDWLDPIGGAEFSNFSASAPVKGVIPLISSVRAGTWGEINDHFSDGEETFAVRESKVGPSAFALKVEGDSMTWSGYPNFPEGTVLVVDPDRSPKAGDFVIAKNTDRQAALFKKLVTDGYAWQLKSLNPDFKPIDIDDPAVRVIGVVVEFWAGGKL